MSNNSSHKSNAPCKTRKKNNLRSGGGILTTNVRVRNKRSVTTWHTLNTRGSLYKTGK
jgi:hypothetical protein